MGASTNHIKIGNIEDDILADVVTFLVENGYRIFKVVREKESLEDIFLSLTREV